MAFTLNGISEAGKTVIDPTVTDLDGAMAGLGPDSTAADLLKFQGLLAINGTITHIVPMLIDRGTPPPQAVQAIQVAGLAIIGGRILSGYFLDRVWGPYVALAFFGLSILGMGILATGAVGGLALMGAVLCGAGIGAEIDIMGYLLSRYFGMRNFGKIYGLVFAAFNLGTGFGPAISGWTFDMNKSYTPILIAYMVILALVCVALLTLGQYAYKPREEPTGPL